MTRSLIAWFSLFASTAIHALGKAYRKDFSLPNLKLPFNNRKGFYIVIPAQDVEESPLPNTFIQVSWYDTREVAFTNLSFTNKLQKDHPIQMQVTRQGKSFHCTTQELTSVHTALPV